MDKTKMVYVIVHNPTGKIYIGSTERGEYRIKHHINLLKSGKHHNKSYCLSSIKRYMNFSSCVYGLEKRQEPAESG